MNIDFHTHSTNSDGEKTPKELLEIAKSKDSEGFCITDHDIFDNQLKNEFHKNGIWTPTGVEITSSIDFMPKGMKKIHITYYANQISDDIGEILKNSRESKKYKIKLQIQRLARFFKCNYSEFVKYWEEYGIGVDNLNSNHIFIYINSIDGNKKKLINIFGKNYNTGSFIAGFLQEDGFDGKPGIGYVEKTELIPNIGEYSQIGGDNKIISIAHPNYSFNQSKRLEENLDSFEEFTKKGKNIGINGVEINLKAPEVWVEKSIEVASKVGLILTFGTDFHREKTSDSVILENNPYLSKEIIKENFDAFKDKIES